MYTQDNSYSFEVNVNDITFHIWSRKHAEKDTPYVSTSTHMHYHNEFHYIYEGEETIVHDDIGLATAVQAGQFCLIPSNTYHSVSSSQEVSRECFFLDIEYSGALSPKGHSDYYLFSHSLSKLNAVTVLNDPFISGLLAHFHQLSTENQPTLDLQRGLLLVNAIMKAVERSYLNPSSAVLRKSKSKVNALRHSRKRTIEEFLAAPAATTAGGLAQLADMLYLSQRQTHNIVKELFGEDYKTLVLRQRMRTAALLIKTTDRSLSEIAKEVGYNSYSGFYTAFINATGTPPERLRKEKKA